MTQRGQHSYRYLWMDPENKIRLGMKFEIYKSKSSRWTTKYKTIGDEGKSSDSILHTPTCQWYIRVITKQRHNMWQITCWVGAHIFLDLSKTIASYILYLIRKGVAYPVKHIQADIKNSLNVDVSYGKAWQGKRKFIETFYETWESNFAELPKYIVGLQSSNTYIIVKWFHYPKDTSQVAKSVAFGPDINAFHLYRHFIYIDGTHLKVRSKEKCWFLFQNMLAIIYYRLLMLLWKSRQSIVGVGFLINLDNLLVKINNYVLFYTDIKDNSCNGKLISLAYHRFCLRHITINLMKRYKNLSLKELCWAISNTIQKKENSLSFLNKKISLRVKAIHYEELENYQL
uniref:MULE transposase domain-containing protein n=1 Tax=Lactuca sativa TaxID=4236 RepID=A0A9R1VHR8_LACSA|nr:hypothetical protein LSAT_V11C500256340 [Lactuca sativa]